MPFSSTSSSKRGKAISGPKSARIFRTGRDNTMKTMTYKGYTAEIIYSDEDECFVGHIVNIDAISGFHGDTDAELRNAFENMIELYIETLAEPESSTQSSLLVIFSHVWVKHFVRNS